MKHIWRITWAVLAFVCLFVSVSYASQVSVETRTYDISLMTVDMTVCADYYYSEKSSGKPLFVMAHGGTYGRWLWDVPGASWKEAVVGGLGYPMLALDLPGYGDSSHVQGDFLTPMNTALAMVKVLKAIKKNQRSPIIWVGHCFGGNVGNYIGAMAPGLIDGLVNLGWLHSNMPITEMDVALMAQGPYINVPNELRSYNYYLPGAESPVIEFDMNHAYALPRGNMWAKLGADRYVLSGILAPVFLSEGDKAMPLMNYSLAEEAALYSGAQSVKTYLQTDTGHLVPLHKKYKELIDEIDTWVRGVVLQYGGE